MTRRMPLILAIAISAAALRLVGLDRRPPTSDEMHYRGDMSNTVKFLRSGSFRDHSVRHPTYFVPHGLLGPAVSYFAAKPLSFVAKPILPASGNARDNLLSRLGYALFSLAIVAALSLVGYRLVGWRGALACGAFSAWSPLLILWGRSEYLDTPMTFFLVSGLYFMPFAVVLTPIQEGSWANWRGQMSTAIAILCAASFVGELDHRRSFLWVIGILGMAFPIAVRDGLRLRPALVDYFGSRYMWSTPLPETSVDRQVFK